MALVFCAMTAPALAQSQPRQRQSNQKRSGRYTLRVNTDEVVFNCTVLDGKGQLVSGLDKRDFRVWDDKKRQTLLSVQQSDSPVSIGLLVDNSGSMRTRRTQVTQAALDLVKASNPEDQTFVVNFSDQAYLDQDFTADLNKLRASLTHPSMIGGTAIYDTVLTASKKLEATASRPRKVLVIITDGEDNASKATLAEAVHEVQRLDGPVIYSIGLLFDPQSDQRIGKARHDLETLSGETGGVAFFPKSANSIDAVAAEVAQAIRKQYTLAYRAPATHSADEYHVLRVETRAYGRSRLLVHTRRGYIAGSR